MELVAPDGGGPGPSTSVVVPAGIRGGRLPGVKVPSDIMPAAIRSGVRPGFAPLLPPSCLRRRGALRPSSLLVLEQFDNELLQPLLEHVATADDAAAVD